MCDFSCRLWKFWNKQQPFLHFRVHDVNGALANGWLNHGQAKKKSLDWFFTSVLSFPHGSLLVDYSGKDGKKRRKGKKTPWSGKRSYNESYEYILYLPSPCLSVFCAEVLRNCTPWLHQGDQKPNQTRWRGDRSTPSSQTWMGVEPVLCFRRAHGTRSTVCWKGNKSLLLCFALYETSNGKSFWLCCSKTMSWWSESE